MNKFPIFKPKDIVAYSHAVGGRPAFYIYVIEYDPFTETFAGYRLTTGLKRNQVKGTYLQWFKSGRNTTLHQSDYPIERIEVPAKKKCESCGNVI